MAHAIHPNYSEKHKSNHRPNLNKGVVIKVNPNQRYATDAISSSILKVIAQKAGVSI
jgi:aspartyl aminopeptidase